MTFIVKFVLEAAVKSIIAYYVTKIWAKFCEWQKRIFEKIFKRNDK